MYDQRGVIGAGIFGASAGNVKTVCRLFRYSGRQFADAAMDIIFLKDLRIDCVIGIWDWERQIRQTVIIDLEMATDIRRAAASDAIDDTLNYKAVAKRLQTFVGDSKFQLIETMAEAIAGIVLKEFQVPWVRVRVNKRGAVRGATDVGVEIERGVRPTG